MPVGVIGGPPCQGFSRGNVHALAADPRNQLPFRYAQIVKEFKRRFGIRFFVFENVLGLLSAKHVARFGDIKDAFKEAGFKVFQSDLNAVAFGVPQRRRRLFIVGLNDTLEADTEFAFPEGTAPAVTLRQAIGQLPAPAYFARGLPTREIPHHANHWTMVPRSPKFTAAVATEGRSFRRLKWDEPSPTVAYGHREIHVHPDGSRRLSVYEAMLLQGFPPKYRLLGCFSSQVTQVSNAVPPPLARVLAKKLHDLVVSKPSGGPEMTEREQVTQVSNAISRPIAAAIAGSLCRVLTSRNELAFAAHSTATR